VNLDSKDPRWTRTRWTRTPTRSRTVRPGGLGRRRGPWLVTVTVARANLSHGLGVLLSRLPHVRVSNLSWQLARRDSRESRPQPRPRPPPSRRPAAGCLSDPVRTVPVATVTLTSGPDPAGLGHGAQLSRIECPDWTVTCRFRVKFRRGIEEKVKKARYDLQVQSGWRTPAGAWVGVGGSGRLGSRPVIMTRMVADGVTVSRMPVGGTRAHWHAGAGVPSPSQCDSVSFRAMSPRALPHLPIKQMIEACGPRPPKW
jgi:hypothetical protein